MSDDIIKLLVKAGASLSTKDEFNRTPLWIALRSSSAICHFSDDIVMNLTSPEVDVDATTTIGNLRGYSSLMVAMMNFRSVKIVEKILKAGAMPTLQRFSCAIRLTRRLIKGPNGYSILKNHHVSPLLAAIGLKMTEYVKLFTTSNFLNSMDLAVPQEIKSIILQHLEAHEDEHCVQDTCAIHNPQDKKEDFIALVHNILNKPKSLHTLSFVNVSTCIGFGSDRQQKLTKTGLPMSLQRQLMYI